MPVSVKEQLHEVLGHLTATQQVGCNAVKLTSLCQAVIKLCHIQLQIEERTNGT